VPDSDHCVVPGQDVVSNWPLKGAADRVSIPPSTGASETRKSPATCPAATVVRVTVPDTDVPDSRVAARHLQVLREHSGVVHAVRVHRREGMAVLLMRLTPNDSMAAKIEGAPGHALRICFFGDSFVNGTGDDDGLGWVGRVVARARQGGCDVTAYNLGIRRDTSADVAARWMREARLRLPPENGGRLVFSFGANDCMAMDNGAGPRVEPIDAIANARTILETARGWLPTLMMGPASVAGSAEANDRIRALSADYASLCESLRVPYLDVCRLTLASPVWTQEVLGGDGAHPNRGGYALVADAVANWPPWRDWITGST
jgi:lysophospholipase L1-like esterase